MWRTTSARTMPWVCIGKLQNNPRRQKKKSSVSYFFAAYSLPPPHIYTQTPSERKMDMPYNPPTQTLELPHKVTLEGRNKLAISGVKDVESFDESMIVLNTVRGTLVVRGSDLHLQMLNLDGGQVAVDGVIDSMVYEEEQHRGGFLSRLWG